ncbi:MAG TPA: acetyl-CoA carboxylase biotin carboxyl carrier protein [Candidatus Marinimicrobia bacterium]|nr:acetyl-CoA carboxylase biotin carboxyl carrier protein [Candidatus Neomarinimicrobiota bacterium]HRU92611.1 acetyl-CoA carboxylase biotin carboxyl carrier protein [Candidatus Neomarinimicrobiota bacterium]
MRKEKILELVRILESHEIDEIEISRWGQKIRISKNSGAGISPEVEVSQAPQKAKKVHQQQLAETAAFESRTAVTEEINHKGVEVRSPIVGTFYRSPAPDAEPYVNVGDDVAVGQPLCIIEAMKIMNVIEAEVAGKVVKILAENAQPVEYNQPLFIIEKTE